MGVLKAFFTATILAGLSVLGTYFYRYKRKLKLLEPWRPVGTVEKLHVYPLKSGKKVEVDEAECTRFGLRTLKVPGKYQLRDRQFVIYNAYDNEVRNAGTYPKIVLIEASAYDENTVAFKAPGMITLLVKIPTPDKNAESYIVARKEEKIYSIDCGDEAATWISRYVLEKNSGLRLGYHDAQHKRDITKHYEPFLRVYKNLSNDAIGLYCDLASYILVNKESVEDVINRIPENGVCIDNFRPNVLINGPHAYEEDKWDLVRIGDVVFEVVKPCTRTNSATVNPQLGVRNPNREPLNTLEKYRKVTNSDQRALEKNAPVLGICMGLLAGGNIKIGDAVYVK